MGLEGIENLTGDEQDSEPTEEQQRKYDELRDEVVHTEEKQPITLDELNAKHLDTSHHNAVDRSERRPVDSVGRAIYPSGDDESARKQEVRDDSEYQRELAAEQPSEASTLTDSQPDTRVTDTENDEEQQRRAAARADSEQAGNDFRSSPTELAGDVTQYVDSDEKGFIPSTPDELDREDDTDS